jgi:hypothetical protein
MPYQNKSVITVGPSYSLAGCSSAEPASASLDKNIVTQKIGKETRTDTKLNRLFVESSSDDSLKIVRTVEDIRLWNTYFIERGDDLVP